jgi:hypothetical protein
MARKMKREAHRRTVGRTKYPRASRYSFDLEAKRKDAQFRVSRSDRYSYQYVSDVTPRGIGGTN